MRPSLLLLACFAAATAAAQEKSLLTLLDLETMAAFQSPGPNWRLASAVHSDRNERWSLDATPGTGILVNISGESAGDNLFTRWTHGDLELKLKFLMPKGSNAGVYFQGRYEVQLLDSWLNANPSFADAGGIYQRWDATDGRGYEGHSPRINASRAPGLWQTLHVVFRAPRFDNSRHKTQDARFVEVTLNGVELHREVVVSGPTRAAAFSDEAAAGPLMIQGDHGPIALRNIQYKRYSEQPVTTTDVQYRLYLGNYTEPPSLVVPTEEGILPSLAEHAVQETQPVLLAYEGNLVIPDTGAYRFSVALEWITGDPHFKDRRIGAATLAVGDQSVVRHDTNATRVSGMASLEAGTHPFSFVFHKSVGGRAPRVTLAAEGVTTPVTVLTAAPQRANRTAPILVRPGRRPTILRGFVQHEGSKRTHAVSVGDPSGVHFSLDLATGMLLHVWRGPFLDVTAMWHNRGHDQLAEPLGSTMSLPALPVLVAPGSTDSLLSLGYRLDDEGRPVFRYALGKLEIEDSLTPSPGGPFLRRSILVTAHDTPPVSLHVPLASGIGVNEIRHGSFELQDRSWYIELPPDTEAHHDAQSLSIPVHLIDGVARVTYEVVW